MESQIKIIFFLIFSILIEVHSIFAQSYLSQLSYDINISKGFIVRDIELAPHLSVSNPDMIEARILYQSEGKKDWERWYQKPRYGLNLNYTHLRNEQLGDVIGVQWIVDLPILKRKKSYLGLVTGIGIGLVTNPYDRHENHKNRLIGSTLNTAALAHIHYSIPLSQNLRFRFGFGATHYSNGAMALPNAGINYVSLDLGLTFQKSETPAFESHKTEKPNWEKNRYIDFYVAGGWREQYPTDGPHYYILNANLSYSHRLSKKFTFQTGLDFVYNQLYTDWQFEEVERGAERISWVVGGEIPMGRFATFFQVGIYIYKPHNFDSFSYNRLGWKYNVFKNSYAIFAVKAQEGEADNLEFGLGYRF